MRASFSSSHTADHSFSLPPERRRSLPVNYSLLRESFWNDIESKGAYLEDELKEEPLLSSRYSPDPENQAISETLAPTNITKVKEEDGEDVAGKRRTRGWMNRRDVSFKEKEKCDTWQSRRSLRTILLFILLFGLLTFVTKKIYDYILFLEPGTNIWYGKDGGIVLLGDSLIRRSCLAPFNLTQRIAANVSSERSFGYSNLGVDSDTIERIKLRLPNILKSIAAHHQDKEKAISTTPTLVFMVWDSDVSDTDYAIMGPRLVAHRKVEYARRITAVIRELQRAGAIILGLAGPAVLLDGEGKSRLNSLLESFADIKRRVALENNIQYLDLRAAFLAALAKGENPTVDGEHPDIVGTRILADLISRRLQEYMNTTTALSSSSP